MAGGDGHWVTVAAESKSIDKIFEEILERFVQYDNEDRETTQIEDLMHSLFK